MAIVVFKPVHLPLRIDFIAGAGAKTPVAAPAANSQPVRAKLPSNSIVAMVLIMFVLPGGRVEQPSYKGIKRPNVDELETLSKSRGRDLEAICR